MSTSVVKQINFHSRISPALLEAVTDITMSEIVSIEIDCADDGSFALNV